MSVLVLVTGAARSGTSTMAGALHHLGLDVPGPYLRANASNPKGFYESRWAVRFHNRLIVRAGINVVDGRPDAFDRVQAVIDGKARRQLAGYLARHDRAPQLVVKDPRTVWAQQLWRDVGRDEGREVRYLSMLRHPAEVVSSRTTYYARGTSANEIRQQSTLNLMRWINTSLVSERETRGAVRSFAGYAELLQDWRGTMARVGAELGLRFDPSVDQRPHPVDDFIDPGLRRHTPSWDGMRVPDVLRSMAQEVWDAQVALAGSGGSDADAWATLDQVGAAYHRLVDDGLLLSQETIQEAVRAARAAGIRQGRRDARATAVPPPAGPEARPVGDVRSRELLGVVTHRLINRSRR